MFAPDRQDARQAAYAEHRRLWRAAYLAWIADGRPGSGLGVAAVLIYQSGLRS